MFNLYTFKMRAKSSFLTPLKAPVASFVVKFLLTANSLLVLFLYTNTRILNKPQLKASFEKAGVGFDSRTKDPALSSLKTFSSNAGDGQKDLSIHLRMKVYALSGYNNVFQTAPMNEGIRLEMSKPSTIALIVGSQSTADVKAFVIDNALALNRWYDLTLDDDKEGHLHVQWNGAPVVDFADATQGFRYKISEIWVGGGYNRDRLMDGVVSDFGIRYRFYSPPHLRSRIWVFRLFFMGTWILWAAVVWRQRAAAGFARIWQTHVLNPRLKLTILIFLLGLASAVLFHGLEFRLLHPGAYLPYGTFLCDKGDLFNDFFNSTNIPNFPASFWGIPPLNLVFCWFWKGMRWLFSDTAAYVMYTLSWIGLLAFALRRLLDPSRENVLSVMLILFLSYPFIFTVNRGNQAGFVAALYALGIFSFQKRHFGAAAFLLSLSAGLKTTPVLFGLFFIGDRQWKYFGLFGFLYFLHFLLPGLLLHRFILASYGPSTFIKGMQTYFETYAVQDNGLAWGTSLWGAIKYVLYSFGGFTSVYLQKWFSIYKWLVVLLLIPAGYACAKKEVALLDRVILITCWLLLAPHVMADYYLTLLYIPLVLASSDELHPQSFIYLVLICLAMIPKAYIWLGRSNVSIGVLLNPIILLCLWAICSLHVFLLPGDRSVLRKGATAQEPAL